MNKDKISSYRYPVYAVQQDLGSVRGDRLPQPLLKCVGGKCSLQTTIQLKKDKKTRLSNLNGFSNSIGFDSFKFDSCKVGSLNLHWRF
jgi:hypothetical protein